MVGVVTPAPAAGVWVHVVATYHESKVQIFVNGQRITEQRVCGPGRYSEKWLNRDIYIYICIYVCMYVYTYIHTYYVLIDPPMPYIASSIHVCVYIYIFRYSENWLYCDLA